jgi:hypothetical protein
MIIWLLLQHVPVTSIVLWRLCLVVKNVSPVSHTNGMSHRCQFIATYPGIPTLTCMNTKVAMCTLHTTALSSGIPQAVSKLARQCVVQQCVLLRGVDKWIGRIWARVPQAHPQRKSVLHGLRPQQRQVLTLFIRWDVGNATCCCVGHGRAYMCAHSGGSTTHFDDTVGPQVASSWQPQWVAIQDV